jgi:hypothetical protein
MGSGPDMNAPREGGPGRGPMRGGPARAPRPPATDKLVALVDARFLAWLVGQNAPHAEGAAGHAADPVLRRRVGGFLMHAMRENGIYAQLHRIYWYSDRPDGQMVDGQVLRAVASVDGDGGLAMMRAIAHDLAHLAQHRACEHLLVASDDDRLIATVDAAQQHGLLVHLLVDERVRDARQLREDDTGWSMLLAQGDRRAMVTAAMLAELASAERSGGAGFAGHGHGGAGGHAGPASYGAARGAAAEAAVDREMVQQVVATWWKDQDMPQRDLLHEALPKVRGLPQEADRELLMRLGQQLGRPLTVPEKKVMREAARAAIVAAGDSADQPIEDDEDDRDGGGSEGSEGRESGRSNDA